MHRMPSLSLWRWLISLLLLSLQPSLQANAADVLRYPVWADGDAQRSRYVLEQLQLALDKAGSSLRLQPSSYGMEQGRALADLERGRNLDVVWSMTSREREAHLLPVRIPLDKGLLGWRIALLPGNRATLLKDVRSLDDLRQFTAGQGHDWPDQLILSSNGLPVKASSSYAGLFQMLKAQRFDYLPRSVMEIWDELDHPRSEQLVADEYLLLRYPTALYFFFSPQRPELAQTVREGMEAALADGSFDQLFHQHFGASLQRARLAQRHVIHLHNPLLPEATPLYRPELWFNAQEQEP